MACGSCNKNKKEFKEAIEKAKLLGIEPSEMKDDGSRPLTENEKAFNRMVAQIGQVQVDTNKENTNGLDNN